MADEKKKVTRTVKPVYVVMNVTDNDGNTIALTKENVNIVSVHKNSDELLDILDSGGIPEGSFYKRVPLA